MTAASDHVEWDGSVDPTCPLVFATYAESDEQLRHCVHLAESIRSFAGVHCAAPIWVYLPEGFVSSSPAFLDRLEMLRVEVRRSGTPAEAVWFYFAPKVFAAAAAEGAMTEPDRVLVWMDEDTIVLRPPDDLVLADGVSLAYRPVMHNRSGSSWGETPDPFWRRIYDRLAVSEDRLWSMTTPADRQKIRAYFNAGLIAVRPDAGILRRWAEDFEKLYTDSVLVGMCREDVDRRIFLHQTALVGAVVNHFSQSETVELSLDYNYPIFFHQQYEAAGAFESIETVVTLRYDVYFRDPDPMWAEKLQGSPEVISWLKERLGKE